jgi:hypothetical protein
MTQTRAWVSFLTFAATICIAAVSASGDSFLVNSGPVNGGEGVGGYIGYHDSLEFVLFGACVQPGNSGCVATILYDNNTNSATTHFSVGLSGLNLPAGSTIGQAQLGVTYSVAPISATWSLLSTNCENPDLSHCDVNDGNVPYTQITAIHGTSSISFDSFSIAGSTFAFTNSDLTSYAGVSDLLAQGYGIALNGTFTLTDLGPFYFDTFTCPGNSCDWKSATYRWDITDAFSTSATLGGTYSPASSPATDTPEPSTLLLVAPGVFGVWLRRMRLR